jgi:hypothetical protein
MRFDSRQTWDFSLRNETGYGSIQNQYVLGALISVLKHLRVKIRTPSNANVKNEWSFTSSPLYTFMAWCLGRGATLPLPYLIYESNVTKQKQIKKGM